ncbi:MAG TPA: pyruvate kinase [Anaeromyxobacteraceae bacterium]|nr:pyruvate kinase [Anaeromyxobacteraceae bacterium]
MRRAKIVATLGPSSSDPGTIQQLLELGVDVARLNFSHGRHEDHAAVLDRLRAASRHLSKAVAALQDLQGPKIRTGPLRAGKVGVELREGDAISITTAGEVLGDEKLVSTTYPHLASDVRSGDRLLVDDGLIELRVVDTDGVCARCEVVEGGVLKPNKGINLPGVALRADALSEKDRVDLAFGLSHGVDFVALSFVRTPEDVAACRAEMERAGRVVPIIAKIEKPEAIDNLDGIVAAADGLMVARGDLGVEIAPERVPAVQKEIVRKGSAAGKPVIIATQMLESMIEHPRPTRAEASDVANAIWDGADAVMLSGESASGKYPQLAVEMMDRIIREAETAARADDLATFRVEPSAGLAAPPPRVVAAAACRAAAELGAVAICCFTNSGDTARLVSHFRPGVPVVGLSPDQSIRRRLALYWGVVPKIMEPVRDPDLMAAMVSQRLVAERMARPGDRVVLVYGSPLGVRGMTNSMRLHEIPADPGRANKRT